MTDLGHADGLLLHGLVDRGPVAVVHLIELVDETDPLVSENKGSCLQRPLLGQLGLLNIGSQTDCRSTLSSGEDSPGSDALNVLQEAGLRSAWVAAHQHVQVSTNLVLVSWVLGDATEQGKGKGALDIVVAVDGGGDAGDDSLSDALVLRQSVDGLDVLLSHGVRGRLLVVPHDVVGDDHSGEDGEAVLGVQAGVVAVAVDSSQLDLITRSNLNNADEEYWNQ